MSATFTSEWLARREAKMSANLPAVAPSSRSESERELHEQIKKFCNDQWPKWPYINSRWGVPSTIAPGCQDFTIFSPHKVFCIECKAAGGKVDPDQRDWHYLMKMAGHVVEVVWSFEDFLKLVNPTTYKPDVGN